jgi:hypothetical protein
MRSGDGASALRVGGAAIEGPVDALLDHAR